MIKAMRLFCLWINFFVIISLMASMAWADEIAVFDVRKNIPLNDTEPVYKDFYINAGSQKGIKKGWVVSVIRKTPVHDFYKNKPLGQMLVPIGQLKIIHVENRMSVARAFSVMDNRASPLSEYNGIMIGDLLDLSSALTVDEEKKSAKKETYSRKEASVVKKIPKVDAIQLRPVDISDSSLTSESPESVNP